MTNESILQQMLHAAYMIEYCKFHDRAKRGKGDVSPMLGIMDWCAELQRLRELCAR